MPVEKQFAKKLAAIRKSSLKMTPFRVMDIYERGKELERAGRSIIHLEVGEPDFPTPQVIVEAAVEAMRKGYTRYTESMGIPELREAIAWDYHDKYGVIVSPDQIVITSGSSPAMLLAFAALLEKGDQVILSDPHYACYPNYLIHLDARPVYIKTYENDAFQLRPEAIKEKLGNKTKAIIINSPANPTGHLLSENVMKQIAEIGPLVVSDEIYHGLVYEGKEHTILEYTDRAIVLNGFSKRHCMTGWRLGYLIAPREYVRAIQVLQQNFFIAPNAFVQWAGVAAIRQAQGEIKRMVARFNERRKLIMLRLREMGFRLPVEPQGAFYVFVNARHIDKDSLRLANRLLEEAGVAVSPGIDSGKNGEGFLRISYASSLENITEGMDRLQKFVEQMNASNKRSKKQQG